MRDKRENISDASNDESDSPMQLSAQFFGYGSLVNRQTHSYPNARPAKLIGWQRVWVHVESRPVAYLSAERSDGAAILGLVAEVPGNDWAALDVREAAYDRHPVEVSVQNQLVSAQVYAVPTASQRRPSTANPLILSYIDVVVQGFLQVFGPEGAQHFFDTTQGWTAPILNDRENPRYPRAQRLSAEEIAIVDAGLAGTTAWVIPDNPEYGR